MRSNPGVRLGLGAAFVFIRQLERLLPPGALRCALSPIIAARVALKRNHASLPLPACLGGGSFQITKHQQRKYYFNSALEFFSDRLSAPKWRDRLQIDGIEYLASARQQKRPVILAFWHFGPYILLRFWLRAAGFPAANLVEGELQNRPALKQLKDRVTPFPEIPTAFHRVDQLREAIKFVATGNPLLIAVDVLNGKQMSVPVDQHCQFGMANGAIRIAMRSGADLIPCSIVEVGAWRFQIRLGPPVPAPLMSAGDPVSIGKHLFAAMLPTLRKHPEQCTERLVKQFVRIDSKNAALVKMETTKGY